MKDKDIKEIRDLLKEDREHLISALPDKLEHSDPSPLTLQRFKENKEVLSSIKEEIREVRRVQREKDQEYKSMMKEYHGKHEENMAKILDGINALNLKQVDVFTKEEVEKRIKEGVSPVSRWGERIALIVMTTVITALMSTIII